MRSINDMTSYLETLKCGDRLFCLPTLINYYTTSLVIKETNGVDFFFCVFQEVCGSVLWTLLCWTGVRWRLQSSAQRNPVLTERPDGQSQRVSKVKVIYNSRPYTGQRLPTFKPNFRFECLPQYL